MTRVAWIVVAMSLTCSRSLSGQQPGPIQASLERDARRLAAVLTVPNQPASDSTARSDGWDTVRALAAGTPVLVTTSREPAIKGNVVVVDREALQIGGRRGRSQTIPREDVREIRLGHRIGVGQQVALGLLIGGVAGYLVGGSTACEAHVCGGERGLAVAGGTMQGVFMGGMGGFIVGQAVQSRPGRLIYARAKT